MTALWPSRYEWDELLSVGFLVAWHTLVVCLVARGTGVA